MKKLSAILLCFLMIFTCSLAGCATFSIDKVKYYNEVLAKVGDTHITRYDLLSAYNSYGNSYFVNQQGQSEDEALKSTLDLLIDRESLYQYGVENNGRYKPTAYQVNEIVKELYDSLNSQMEDYLSTGKQILNIEEDETAEEEKTEDEKTYLYSDYVYKKRAELVNDKIVYIVEAEEEITHKYVAEQYLNDHTKEGIIEEIKTNYFGENGELDKYIKENSTEKFAELKTQCIRLMTTDLMEYEHYLRDTNGKQYSKNTEDLLSRYIERTFTSQIKEQYLTNIRNYFLENEELDVELLLNEYKYLARVSHDLYDEADEAEDYKTAMKDISTNGDSVLYHPETDSKFGYFIHTLISFSEDQKTKIKALENEGNKETAENKKNEIIAETKIQARNSETGLIDEDAEYVSLSDVIAEYNTITGTYEQKLAKFIQFMFKYTGDTATLTAGMPYVIGYNPNTYTGTLNSDDKLDGTYSAMVTEFTKEAIDLMKTNNNGQMSTISLGNVGEMCITEYGIHLLFYVGNVNSYDVNYSDIDSAYITSENQADKETLNLYNKVLNPLTGKTYFDMLFDKVYPASSGEVFTSNTGYNDEEERIINEIQGKTGHEVVKYTTRINATKTKI